MLYPVVIALELITSDTPVPFIIYPIFKIPVSLSYSPGVAYGLGMMSQLRNSNSFGRMSDKFTFVAVVPFAALRTVMVHTTVSFILHSSLSTVFVTDTSTIGFTLIVAFTVLFDPFGAMSV